MINDLKLFFRRWLRIVILAVTACFVLWFLLNFGSFLNKAEEFKESTSLVLNSLPVNSSMSSMPGNYSSASFPDQPTKIGAGQILELEQKVTMTPIVTSNQSDKYPAGQPLLSPLTNSGGSIKPSVTPTPMPIDTPTPSPSTTPNPTPNQTPTTSLASSVSPAPSPSATTTPVITPTASPIPEPSLPKVIINEIAWMGTKASQYAEWIELYNATGGEIDLSGWAVFEAGGDTKVISLEGVIHPYGYFLIERTTPSSPDAIIDIIADIFGSFGGSGLSNTGEKLVLKDENGNVQDIVDGSSGWHNAGIASPDYKSMERINPKQSGDDPTNWGTNDGLTKNGLDGANNQINGTPRNRNSVQN